TRLQQKDVLPAVDATCCALKITSRVHLVRFFRREYNTADDLCHDRDIPNAMRHRWRRMVDRFMKLYDGQYQEREIGEEKPWTGTTGGAGIEKKDQDANGEKTKKHVHAG